MLFEVLLCLCRVSGNVREVQAPSGPSCTGQGCAGLPPSAVLEEKKNNAPGEKNFSSACTSWISAVPEDGSNF